MTTRIDAERFIRAYDPVTIEFGACNPSGTTRTYFAPTRGRAYFNVQPGAAPEYPW